MEKENLVVFTGAGVSAESGVDTFRTDNGLWMNHKVEDVATPEGFKKDKDKVNEFYNNLRELESKKKPNGAHMLLSHLEDDYNVTIVTQNVDSLHERGGSSNVIHLHGELNKVRSLSNTNDVIYWGDKPITKEDNLRPHIVWFGEQPLDINKSIKSIKEADVMVIIGTSFNIEYTIELVNKCGLIPIYFIDPNPDTTIFGDKEVTFIREKAVKGMSQLYEILNKEKEINNN